MKQYFRAALVGVFLLNASPYAGAQDEAPSDKVCLDKARTQGEINTCFHRSTTVEARKLSTLLRELESRLTAEQTTALYANDKRWKTQVVVQCKWEMQFFSGGTVADGVLASCLADHTRARVDRLKRFLCEGAGATGPCEASLRY